LLQLGEVVVVTGVLVKQVDLEVVDLEVTVS
jgi:hypothetical protein